MALSKLAHCSALFHRSAAPTLVHRYAVALAHFAMVFTPAVMMARSLALLPRVRILIWIFHHASNLLA